MVWLVDTCLIIDVLEDDPDFGLLTRNEGDFKSIFPKLDIRSPVFK